MERLFVKDVSGTYETPQFCPEKMKIVRENFNIMLKDPQFSSWGKEEEQRLITDLSFRNIPDEYHDIQRDARKLYVRYLTWKFRKLDGIQEWAKTFEEITDDV